MMEPATAGAEPEASDLPKGEGQQQPSGLTRSSTSRGSQKAAPITSVRELIDHAYALGGKRVRIPRKTLKDIALNSTTEHFADDGLLARIDTLMVGDALLAVPPRLLVALEEAGATELFKGRLVRVLRHALRVHPLFALPRFQGSPAGPAARDLDHADPDTLSVVLKSRASEISAAELGLSAKQLKPSERDRLRVNTVSTVALISSTLAGWTLAEFVSYLQRHLWKESLARPGSPNPRVSMCETAAPEALGVVAEVFTAEADVARRKAAEAERYVADAAARVENLLNRANNADAVVARLKDVVSARESDIADLRREVATLQGQIDSEQRDRVIDRSHHIDEYELLRTRVVRSLGKQIDLLSDGLHAVRNQSYSVTEEYVERALDALSKELHDLKERGDS